MTRLKRPGKGGRRKGYDGEGINTNLDSAVGTGAAADGDAERDWGDAKGRVASAGEDETAYRGHNQAPDCESYSVPRQKPAVAHDWSLSPSSSACGPACDPISASGAGNGSAPTAKDQLVS